MTGHQHNLLKMAAPGGARRLFLRHLAAVESAAIRLKQSTDPEALHDFRVALRRLRTVLRSYPLQLRGIGPKRHRQLRKLSRATNAGRDTQVQLLWLARQQASLTPRQRVGCR